VCLEKHVALQIEPIIRDIHKKVNSAFSASVISVSRVVICTHSCRRETVFLTAPDLHHPDTMTGSTLFLRVYN
jgi:hypothetical protein